MEKIAPLLKSFYSDEDIERIIHKLNIYVKSLLMVKPKYFSSTWYKNSNIYATYPESILLNHKIPLENAKEYLKTIKQLGCNVVHLLPFLKSPMRDKGYDISDYYTLREGLGGKDALKAFMKEAEKQEIHIIMDILVNHVSQDHEWFVKAENGSEYYRNFFIHTKDFPQFLRKVEKDGTIYAEYLVNNEKILVAVLFPEFAGEIPHWTQGKDGYWYYHTFYPHQIDLNWHNPEVFIEIAKVLLYWASLGFNFRLDAIPYIGKPAYKHVDTHNPFTHTLTTAINMIPQAVAPHCVFLLETFEHLNSTIEYFGTVNNRQSHLLYNFNLNTALWLSLTEEDQKPIWRQLHKMRHIPVHAQWVNFLRNHDELSLAYLNDEEINSIYKNIAPFGKPFRAHFGIAGRTYSLLGSDEKRFLMAYFLVSSMPGSVLIPYGDEYGMSNTPQSQLPEAEKEDARNINRGVLTKETMTSDKGKRLFAQLATILQKRQILQDYLNIWPEERRSVPGVFGAIYKKGTSEFVIYINLTPHQKTVHFDNPLAYETILDVNHVEVEDNAIKLDAYAGIWLQK